MIALLFRIYDCYRENDVYYWRNFGTCQGLNLFTNCAKIVDEGCLKNAIVTGLEHIPHVSIISKERE